MLVYRRLALGYGFALEVIRVIVEIVAEPHHHLVVFGNCLAALFLAGAPAAQVHVAFFSLRSTQGAQVPQGVLHSRHQPVFFYLAVGQVKDLHPLLVGIVEKVQRPGDGFGLPGIHPVKPAVGVAGLVFNRHCLVGAVIEDRLIQIQDHGLGLV